MGKKIIAILLLVMLITGASSVIMADESGSVTAVNGTVTLEATAPPATPVLLFVLPTIDNDEDLTAEYVAAVKSKSDMDALNVKYIEAIFAGNDGKIEHTCRMISDLDTGMYSVVISYLGTQKNVVCSLGTFEHVSAADIEILIKALNSSTASDCGKIIDEDINGAFDADGVTRLTPKEILRKNSADVNYYQNLTDKTTFHKMYYQIKGDEDFTESTLFTCFNQAAVWTRLRTEKDTFAVLKNYNGTGIGKYWNIEIDENSDFAKLGDEQKKVLEFVKLGKYIEKAGAHTANELLEKDFRNLVLMGMFRNLETREALAELISEKDLEGNPNPYADDFAGVRDILEDASLDAYKLIGVQNKVLSGADNCYTMADVEALFENSLPEEEISGGTGGGGGGSFGPVVADKKNPVLSSDSASDIEKEENNMAAMPFLDVANSHWAKKYIEALYQKGSINGKSKEIFDPEGSIFRQDFVKILVGALGMNVTSTEKSVFSDVPTDAYYTNFVVTAYENGLIQGNGSNFGVGMNITRQDVAVIISRVLEKNGMEFSNEAESFKDEGEISEYAKQSVKVVRAAGIFGGNEKGNFNPKDYLSRAEACAVLWRLAELLGEV